MSNLPSISIITCILNVHLPTFKLALDSIKQQKYPKRLIQHIVMDGGSTNDGPKLAKKYGCLVTIRTDLKTKDTVRAALAIKKAKGELILILESDNILTSKDWLEKMVKPYLENKKVFCTYSVCNSYYKNMSATTRYCALFGSPDPTLYYLNKTEKIRMDEKNYNKGKLIEKTSDCYIVQFNKDNLPTLGDNGHMFLSKPIKRVVKDPEEYLHTDTFVELLNLGYDTFGVVNNSIVHIQNSSIINMVKRRIEVKEEFYDKRRGKRKYMVFNWDSYQDRINLIKYIIFSLTFIIPLIESIKGYIKIRDRAWFLHPLVCFLMVIGYGISEIRWFLKKLSF